MSTGLMFRRTLYSTLKSQRSRSASCHARYAASTCNSRSTDRIFVVEPKDIANIRCYSTHISRHWKPFDTPSKSSKVTFTLMSYNILAQHHIDSQPSLYQHHNPDSLHWSHRFDALKREIGDISPDILCLQEVQQNHLKQIAEHFQHLGYDTSLYKKRTGLQVDGCAIFFKKDLFELVEFHFVDYFQPDIKILNRCNVAIIAKFALKSKPDINFVVSTTHLLFNPKRHDIRLAQIQVLLAELDRIARDDTLNHVPIILTGDFNVPQTSEVFKLVIGESINPGKLFEKMQFRFNVNDKALLPSEMGISDNCQHLDVVVNSNRYQTALHTGVQNANGHQSCESKTVQKRIINCDDIEKSNLPFNTGVIQHHLNLVPTFCPSKPFKMNTKHASTFHSKWIMVDYIFFSESSQSRAVSSKLRLLDLYQLPTQIECLTNGPIPSQHLGSDHYSVAARFSIE